MEADMKEVLSLAVFAGKVLCLMVFVTGLKPGSIGAVQTPAKETSHRQSAPQRSGCRAARAATGSWPSCGVNVLSQIKVCENGDSVSGTTKHRHFCRPYSRRTARSRGSFFEAAFEVAEREREAQSCHAPSPLTALPSPGTLADRKSTRLNSSHRSLSRMPSSA